MKQWCRVHRRHLVYVAIFIVFFLNAFWSIDPDFGWHLMAGRSFLLHGIPQTDIFTYTASNFPWIDHEWLSDVTVASLYGTASYWLVALCYAGLWTAAIVLAGKRVQLSIVVIAAAALLPFAGARTVALSVFGLALVIALLRQKYTKWRLALPLLFLVWANMHGSFVLGLAYVAYRALIARSRPLVILTIVSVVCTFVNPYGAGIYVEVFRTMSDTSLHHTISEWQALALPLASLPYMFVWIAFLVIRNKTAWRRYLSFDVLMFLASVSSMRMTPLFVVVSLPALQRYIQEVGATVPEAAHRLARKGAAIIVVIVLILTTITMAGSVNVSTRQYPWQAVAYLKAHPCDGNLFNAYGMGGFLIWQLPGHKVYIDGRMPSWEQNGRKYMTDYERMYTDTQFRTQQIATYHIRCVVDSRESAIITSLKAAHWRVAVDDGDSVLLLAP